MKVSAVVLSVALAASQTDAFMAPAPMARTSAMFSSEMAEETAATSTTTNDAPGKIEFVPKEDLFLLQYIYYIR